MFSSSTDLAIMAASRADTLRLEERFSERLQEPYFALVDTAGVIEVHLTAEDAEQRIADVLMRHAPQPSPACSGAAR